LRGISPSWHPHRRAHPRLGRWLLTVTGDGLANSLVVSRSAAGTLRVNQGTVPIAGGTATAANTTQTQISGVDGNDDGLDAVQVNGGSSVADFSILVTDVTSLQAGDFIL
jgi:hypothetical protein